MNLDLRVAIAGKTLPNPVAVASGTFGFGDEYADWVDRARLGAVFTKSLTPEQRAGNIPPRLTETTAGMINAIGLANPGLEGFLADKLPILENLPCPAIVNVAGACMADYSRVAEVLDDLEAVWGLELNVSCPNVDQGGMAFGIDPKQLELLTRSIRRICHKPLIVKLSPNVTDIADCGRAAEAGGADALSCINTVSAMKVDIVKKRPAIPRKTGGLSGPAIRPIGVAATWRVAQAVGIPVIGLGGITKTEDALEYLFAGATAVQVGTALFSDPRLPIKILEGIIAYMQEAGFSRLEEFHDYF